MAQMTRRAPPAPQWRHAQRADQGRPLRDPRRAPSAAAAAHQSLQEYLRGRLIAEAATPTVEEILARAVF